MNIPAQVMLELEFMLYGLGYAAGCVVVALLLLWLIVWLKWD